MSVAIIMALAIFVLGGGFGLLMIMAGGMSDAPQAGESAARSGVWVIGGALVLALIVGSSHWWGHVLHAGW